MDDELRGRRPHWGLVLESPQTPAARVQAKAAWPSGMPGFEGTHKSTEHGKQ